MQQLHHLLPQAAAACQRQRCGCCMAQPRQQRTASVLKLQGGGTSQQGVLPADLHQQLQPPGVCM